MKMQSILEKRVGNWNVGNGLKPFSTVDVWGRGTNRVIAMCKRHGAAVPTFEERQGFLVVTFKARMVAGGADPQVTPQVKAVLEVARQAVSADILQRTAGLKDRVHFLKSYLQPLLEQGLLERTISDKPRSRLQRYRTTEPGLTALKQKREKRKA